MDTAMSQPRVANTLIASPNVYFRRQMADALRASLWPVEEAFGGAEALAKVEASEFEVLLLDRWLPDLDVGELVGTVRASHPDVAVYVVDSASATPLVSEEPESHLHRPAILKLLQTVHQPGSVLNVPGHGEGRRQRHPGAASDEDCPLPPGGQCPFEIVTTLGTPPASTQLSIPGEFVLRSPRPTFVAPSPPRPRPVVVLRAEEEPLPGMIGSSAAMQQVYRLARMVAPRNTTVLITGDTGTGKERVARAVHRVGQRASQPLVTINCPAIPEALLEAELFGYARGAFTGAFQSNRGRIHAAHGGTLFLDEVGELPLGMQAKLLRFLQEGEIQRLGSSDVVRVDVRVISATNVDLAERVERKTFREDLYYRLSVFPIEIKPLRKRREDILPLSVYFLRTFCQESGMPEKTISAAAQTLLEEHSWPGNVRELRHVIERAFILSEHDLEARPEHIRLQSLRRPEPEQISR